MTWDEEKSRMIAEAKAGVQAAKRSSIFLSEAMRSNAGTGASFSDASTAAQQIRDEEIIRAAKAKYGEDWNDPEMRAMHDEADRIFGS